GQAGQDRDEGGLPRAVTADQRVGLAGLDGQPDIVEGGGRPEVFADSDRLRDRRTSVLRVAHTISSSLRRAPYPSIRRPGLMRYLPTALLADLVTPERRVVDVVLRHQRRGELV